MKSIKLSFSDCIEKSESFNNYKIKTDHYLSKGKIPIIDQGQEYIAGYTNDNTKKIVDVPAVIFGDHTRCVKYVEFPFALGADGAKVLLPKKDKFVPKFFYYQLLNKKILNLGYSRHYKLLKELTFVCPSIETQKKIVAVLEKAEQIKEKRKKAVNLSDEYLNNLFLQLFGNIKTNEKGLDALPAGDLFEIKLGKMLSAKNFTGKHLKPYLRNINVQWGYLDLSDVKQMDFDEKEFEKYKLKKGDILVCEGGEVGRTAIYTGEIKDCCYQNALHRLRIKQNKILPEYFVYYMHFAAKYGLILRETIQVTIAHFTAEKFNKFKVLLPPMKIQKKFSKEVNWVEELKEKQQLAMEKSNLLFDSLMQKAFRGELFE